ncbi:hypothetical protein Xoosp14_136 [Xanthomonas phage Xoo-sp14]|nr:hypothetical protein Xoosp14_136 [Xanthomonas phage Xoo-sp14]
MSTAREGRLAVHAKTPLKGNESTRCADVFGVAIRLGGVVL